MRKIYSTVMMLTMIFAALSFTACGGDDDEIDNGGGDVSIVGMWECTYFDLDKNTSGLYVESRINIGDRVRFQSDGTIYARFSDGESETGRWSMRGNALIIDGAVRLGDSSSVDVPFEYNVTKLTSTELEFNIDLGILKAFYKFKRVS
jgi:hypothetical protein